MTTPTTLTDRQLNRATLARQLLLERSELSPVDAVSRLAALQAQESASPYLALWSRLRDFQVADLDRAIAARELVKGTLFRQTLHLTGANDYPLFRAAIQSSLNRPRPTDARWQADHPQFATLRQRALDHAAETPRSNAEMKAFLSEIAGEDLAENLWFTLRWTTPLIHAPAPAGTAWSYPRRPGHVDAMRYLGRARLPAAVAGTRHVVLRYLAAFGPASIADIGRWAGIPRGRVRESLEGLTGEAKRHPRLVRFRDVAGLDLYDLEDAPRPDPDTQAPVRLLPMWDNALLGYESRTRVLPGDYRAEIIRPNGDYLPTILVDGVAAGVWITNPAHTPDGRAVIETKLFRPVTPADRTAIDEETHALETFLSPIDRNAFSSYRNRWWTPRT